MRPCVTSPGSTSEELNVRTKNHGPALFLVSGTDDQNSAIPNTGSDTKVPPSVSLIGHIFSFFIFAFICIISLLEDPSADLSKFSWAFFKISNFLCTISEENESLPGITKAGTSEDGSDTQPYLYKKAGNV